VGRGVHAEWVLYTKLCTEVALLVYIVRKLSQSVVIVVPPPKKKLICISIMLTKIQTKHVSLLLYGHIRPSEHLQRFGNWI